MIGVMTTGPVPSPGVPEAADGQRFFLDDQALMWMVEEGYIDLFAVVDSLRHYVMRLKPGEAMFGIQGWSGCRVRLLACATPDSVVRCMPALRNISPALVDRWVASLGTAAGINPESTETSLTGFHRAVLELLDRRVSASEDTTRDRLRAKAISSATAMHSAFQELAAPLSGAVLPAASPATDERSSLPLAFECVVKALGISSPPEHAAALSTLASDEAVTTLARSWNLAFRKVTLSGSWWRHDAEALLGFRSGRAVALIPGKGCRYRVWDPVAGQTVRVDSESAASLEPCAFSFYRVLPEGPATPLRLLWFGVRECRKDLLRIVLTGLAIGLLGLATPLIMARLIGSVISEADRAEAGLLAGLLAVCSLASALFSYSRAIALQRLGGRAGSIILYALWDRLLTLPSSFLGKFAAGELASRASSIDHVRQTITGPLIANALGCPFALVQALLLFHYGPDMAAAALILPALFILASASGALMLVRQHRVKAAHDGAISGRVFQFFSGIAKIRAAGAESRVFVCWARLFGRQRSACMRLRNISAILGGIQAAVPLLGWAVIVFLSGLMGAKTARSWKVSDLFAFSIAFQMVVAAAVQFGELLSGLAQMAPLLERVQPILEATPEFSAAKIRPGTLSGAIEIENLSFHYCPERPLLCGVSFRIAPGEFVAVVGASGCGKSTLLRLMLGFEHATGGAIRYDGQDISRLDLQAVRRQMGVVLQNGRILDGDVGYNILGASGLGLDAAWEAARLAGLDADIEAMPMKMHTRLSEGGGGLSGGQRQRLLIARALVNQPRIVLFDEATSALDNHTQAAVSASIESLKVTRVVIAHRLSTIRNADRILVLDRGEVAESGTYHELMGHRGRFYQMAKRQIL